MTFTTNEIREHVMGVDPGKLPDKKSMSAKEVLSSLSDEEAAMLAGRVSAAQADALKRAGLSRASGKATSPMHEACVWHNAEALANLVTVKNCDRRDSRGFTPLAVAVMCNSPACIELLLGKRADVTAPTPGGATPLHVAASVGLDVLNPIIAHCDRQGISLDAPDSAGRTALMRAISVGKEHTAWRLLIKGADPHAKAESGATPMTVARRHKFNDMVELLEEMS